MHVATSSKALSKEFIKQKNALKCKQSVGETHVLNLLNLAVNFSLLWGFFPLFNARG